MYVDLIVIIPLEEEFIEFSAIFSLKENLTTGNRVTYRFETHGGLTGLVIQQDEMGYRGAYSAVNSIIGEFACGLVVCLGIAGGLSKDIKLGDVCYSGTIIDTTSNGKIEDFSEGGEDLALCSDFFPTRKQITGSLGFVRVMPELRSIYEDWQKSQDTFAIEEAISRGLNDFDYETTKAVPGDIACGLVTESASYKTKLKAIQRKILCIETESGAIGHFCQELT